VEGEEKGVETPSTGLESSRLWVREKIMSAAVFRGRRVRTGRDTVRPSVLGKRVGKGWEGENISGGGQGKEFQSRSSAARTLTVLTRHPVNVMVTIEKPRS